MPNVITWNKSATTAIRDAFYAMHYDLIEGKNRVQALTQYINWNMQRVDWILQTMAEKKKPNSVSDTPYEQIKFVNKNLTTEEKQDHDNANRPVEYVATTFLKLAQSGYSLKVSYDAYSKCMQATLLVWNKACPNYGYGLSARGATAERAVSLLLYKHFDVLHEDWSQAYKAPVIDMEG